jgi:hypothetical protein
VKVLGFYLVKDGFIVTKSVHFIPHPVYIEQGLPAETVDRARMQQRRIIAITIHI